jgi:hypothetical protein
VRRFWNTSDAAPYATLLEHREVISLSRVRLLQFFGLRERSVQKIRRVKSTLAILESDDYACPKSVHTSDAGCALNFHNKDNGSDETAVSVRR